MLNIWSGMNDCIMCCQMENTRAGRMAGAFGDNLMRLNAI